MSALKTTPGPWLVGTGGGGGATTFVYEMGEDGKPKCAIASCTLNYVERPFAEREANARLIAATPWLYDAAEDSLKALGLLRVGMLHDRHALEMIDAHIDELETALAKARGEA